VSKITYFCAAEFPNGRVLYRSNNNANANGGIVYTNAGNDSSNTNANIGSRLDNYPKR
jgi:hypothetical protein